MTEKALALLLATTVVVRQDLARENLLTATVIDYATFLTIVVLMQLHSVLDECLTTQSQVCIYIGTCLLYSLLLFSINY